MDDRPKTGPKDDMAGDNDAPQRGASASAVPSVRPSRPNPRAINLPIPLTIASILMVVIFIVQEYVLNEDQYVDFLITFAFLPMRYVVAFSDQGLEWLWTPVTYSLLHGGVEHIVFNALWLIAFGTPVVRRIGAVRFVLFWALSSAASAFFHAALNWGGETLLVGASGVVSALMGATCRFAFPNGGRYDRQHGHIYLRQSIARTFANPTVRVFAGIWMFGNLLIAIGMPLVGGDYGSIAWDAHVGGFVFGFLLFGFFDTVRYVER